MNNNARKMAADLRNGKIENFNMSDVTHYQCDTPSCILGHALARMGVLQEWVIFERNLPANAADNRSEYGLAKLAYKWLGLSELAGTALCFPNCGNREEEWKADAAIWGTSNLRSPKAAAKAIEKAAEYTYANR